MNYQDLILGLLGGGTIVKLLELIFNRKDKKKSDNDEILKAINDINFKLSSIDEKQKIQEQNQTRVEMLVMMNHYENETFEIMRLAHRYFVSLNGDFTMTSIFAKFLKEHKIEKPVWFDENK